MYWAGYLEAVRRTVATGILAKRETNLENLRNLDRPLYRSKEERRKATKDDKATWFRKGGDTATIMVSSNQGSALAKGIRELLQVVKGPIGTSVKVTERPGRTIHTGIAPNNPFLRPKCHRDDCPYAVAGELCKERCLAVGLIYKGTCMICEQHQDDDTVPEEDRTREIYIGESSRTLYSRVQEHIRD